MIGDFKVNGPMLISDPCYDRGIWCQKEVDVKKGDWVARVDYNKDESRVKELIVLHKDNRYPSEKIWELLCDTITVDSGSCGIFDSKAFSNEEYIPASFETEYRNRWLGFCCSFLRNDQMAGVFSHGVVSCSGYGDGCYELYAAYNQQQEIIGLKLVFITEIDYY